MSDYYTDPEGRVFDQHTDLCTEFTFIITPLVSTGQGDYRRDYTPRLRFRPKWRARQPWWRTLRNPFRTRTA